MAKEFSKLRISVEPTEVAVDLPAVMTIAGSDSSGGAGIEADLKTFNAHGVYGATCIVALTAQNTQRVWQIVPTPKDVIQEILKANFEDLVFGHDVAPLRVIKTGMLTEAAIEVVKEYLPMIHEKGIKLVCDPVMVSTSGSTLIPSESVQLCLHGLFDKVYLLTPNFKEAQTLFKLAKGTEIQAQSFVGLQDFIDFVISLQQALGCENLLVKGGHVVWDTVIDRPANLAEETYGANRLVIIDILYESKEDKVTVFESPYLVTKNSHGTGCTLSSAIASQLAKSADLDKAVALSINYVHRAMSSYKNKLGHGNGPLNHSIQPISYHKAVKKEGIPTILAHPLRNNIPIVDFFKNHPEVSKAWSQYTKHDFVKQLATNQLPFYKFLYFLKQDYYYLLNYAQVHSLASAVAPNYQYIRSQASIVLEVIEEIEKHRKKLMTKYDIEYDSQKDPGSSPKPGKACLDYCNYLLHIANTEDFLGIKVAMAPCLHGYKEAAEYGMKVRTSHPPRVAQSSDVDTVYTSWLQDYTSAWYAEANENGLQDLKTLFESDSVDDKRLQSLVHIFKRVTELEVGFWDEVLTVAP